MPPASLSSVPALGTTGALRPTVGPGATPLVSIIMFVRNGRPQLKRAVESVLGQSYENLEFVIQDGQSSDGTVEYITSLRDPRIKLISEKDAGPADAFARAIRRCQGSIIGTCLADEELLPNAVSRIVEVFASSPHLGAITGDADVIDIEGNRIGDFVGAPFNIIKYLLANYCPYWCSSFFKADALKFIGVLDDRWSSASLEFEIWIRLAMETEILYLPEKLSKYGIHENQLSQSSDRVVEEMESRLSIIENRLFGKNKYFGEDDELCNTFCLMQLINLYRHLSGWSSPAADKIYEIIVQRNYLREFNRLFRYEGPSPEPSRGAIGLTGSQASGDSAVTAGDLSDEGGPAKGAASGPFARPPASQLIIPAGSLGGRLYRRLVPTFVRAAIPQDAKDRIGALLGYGRPRS